MRISLVKTFPLKNTKHETQNKSTKKKYENTENSVYVLFIVYRRKLKCSEGNIGSCLTVHMETVFNSSKRKSTTENFRLFNLIFLFQDSSAIKCFDFQSKMHSIWNSNLRIENKIKYFSFLIYLFFVSLILLRP